MCYVRADFTHLTQYRYGTLLGTQFFQVSSKRVHQSSYIDTIDTSTVLRWRGHSLQNPYTSPILSTPTEDLPNLLQHANCPTGRPRVDLPGITFAWLAFRTQGHVGGSQ